MNGCVTSDHLPAQFRKTLGYFPSIVLDDLDVVIHILLQARGGGHLVHWHLVQT